LGVGSAKDFRSAPAAYDRSRAVVPVPDRGMGGDEATNAQDRTLSEVADGKRPIACVIGAP